MDLITRIKAHISIADVAQAHIPNLHRTASGYKALCPFHEETEASFHLYTDDDHFHCFGCDAHGDQVDLLAHFEGREVDKEYVAELADRYGLSSSPDRYRDHKQALSALARRYHRDLWESPAYAYLSDRGITDETIKTWALGYADGTISKGDRWPPALADLGYIQENDHGPYDLFRHRLVIPIVDGQQVVGFGARKLPGHKSGAKYLNSYAHPLFDKSKLLFGLDHCELSETLVIVEGYFDVIAAHQAGFHNVVAPMGTQLTKQHLAKLQSRQIEDVVIVGDGDKAGKTFVFEAGKRITTHLPDVSVRGFFPCDGEDPDDILLRSPAEWAFCVENASPLWMLYVDTFLPIVQAAGARDQQTGLRRMVTYLSELDTYSQMQGTLKLAETVHASYTELTRLGEKASPTQPKPAKASNVPPIVINTLAALERYPHIQEHINLQFARWGLSPIGALDFGSLWGQAIPVSAIAETTPLRDPYQNLSEAMLTIRKKRVRTLLQKRKEDPTLAKEWQTLQQHSL